MNGRTCQFCGKSLSRLRVGGDGDFCSKEHRTQHRLRAGMDRLMEVNKVASLMRRRESARQISTASLMRDGLIAPRPFLEAQPARIDPTPRLIAMRLDATTQPRITAFSDRCATDRLAPAAGRTLAARTSLGDFRMRSRETRPTEPAWARRIRLGDTVLSGASRAHAVSARPAQGNALRVSIGVAFRVPPVEQPSRRSTIDAVSGLASMNRPHPLSAGSRSTPSEYRPLAIDLPELPPTLPLLHCAIDRARFDGRGALQVNGFLFRDAESQPRPSGVPWNPAGMRYIPYVPHAPAGLSRRTRLFPLPVTPNTTASAHRSGESPFPAREEFFLPEVEYFNVLAAAVAMAEEPAAPAAAAPAPVAPPRAVEPEFIRHEEHFDAGWDNWVGGVDDWKVDVAGVRPGSLALFLPTLDWSDYDLEFLVRIDTRTVNWVVRAAGRDTYLLCTLTAVDGRVEFSRAVVTAGVSHAAVIAPQQHPVKPRTAMTVRMSMGGPVFSVSVDGRVIDSWVDDRLPHGGIGFVGAPDDRARIYWVRVCAPAGPSKEQILQ